MARLTLRAVERPDGQYRISITPAQPEVDTDRAYSAAEIRQLAERIHAKVQWAHEAEPRMAREAEPNMTYEAEPDTADDAQPSMTHEAEPDDQSYPDTSPAASSEDLWGGTLSTGNED